MHVVRVLVAIVLLSGAQPALGGPSVSGGVVIPWYAPRCAEGFALRAARESPEIRLVCEKEVRETKREYARARCLSVPLTRNGRKEWVCEETRGALNLPANNPVREWYPACPDASWTQNWKSLIQDQTCLRDVTVSRLLFEKPFF